MPVFVTGATGRGGSAVVEERRPRSPRPAHKFSAPRSTTSTPCIAPRRRRMRLSTPPSTTTSPNSLRMLLRTGARSGGQIAPKRNPTRERTYLIEVMGWTAPLRHHPVKMGSLNGQASDEGRDGGNPCAGWTGANPSQRPEICRVRRSSSSMWTAERASRCAAPELVRRTRTTR